MKLLLLSFLSIFLLFITFQSFSQIKPDYTKENVPEKNNLLKVASAVSEPSVLPLIRPVIAGNAKQSQNITISYDWSMISTYLIPSNPSTEAVFSPVISSLIIVKDDNGGVYWPAVSFNNMASLAIGEGYLVKMTASATLSVTGTAVVPELTPITIPYGHGIFGYLRQSPMPLSTLYSQFSPYTIMLVNSAGAVWWPQFQLDNIDNLNPGEGYRIFTNSAFTLTYPAN